MRLPDKTMPKPRNEGLAATLRYLAEAAQCAENGDKRGVSRALEWANAASHFEIGHEMISPERRACLDARILVVKYLQAIGQH